jgi:lauroyl/myristoyl acyltransferase
MNVLKSIKMGLWLVRNIPAPLLRPLPYCFGALCYVVGGESRRTVIANQRQILGLNSPLRLHWQTLRVMVNLMHSYHTLVRLPTMTDEEIRQTVIFQGGEVLDAALEQGRGAIILGAHIAGFNILAPFTALRNQPAGAFVEPIRPPELFQFVSQIRARTGMQLFLADREGAAGALRLLRQNGVLLIAADRYLGTNGARVPLFGRPADLSHGPIVLAQRHGTPILPTTLRRLKDGRFLAQLHPPLPLADTGNRRADLETNMRLVAGALERTIGGSAEQWLIFEPMWQTQESDDARESPRPPQGRHPRGMRRWFANATLLLLITRPFRRRGQAGQKEN